MSRGLIGKMVNQIGRFCRPTGAVFMVLNGFLCALLLTTMLSACSVARLLTDSEQEKGPFMQRLLTTADTMLARNDHQNALLLYEKILFHSDSVNYDLYGVQALNGYGETLIHVGRTKEALDVFQRSLIEQEYDNERAHLGLAKAYLTLEQTERAIEHYGIVLQEFPDNPYAYNGLGVAYDSQGLHDQAQRAYQKGLSYAPEHIALSNNLGVSLILSGRFQQAINVLKERSFDEKASAKIRQNLAFAYAFMGELETAERISRIDLDPDASRQHVNFFQKLRAEQIANLNKRHHENNVSKKEKPAMTTTHTPPPQPQTPSADGMDRMPPKSVKPIPSDGRADIYAQPKIIEALNELKKKEEKETIPPANQQKEQPTADKQAIVTTQPAALDAPSVYTVQVATYRSFESASRTAQRLRQKGYTPRIEQIKGKKGSVFHVLRIGYYNQADEAVKTIERVYETLGVLGEIRITKRG